MSYVIKPSSKVRTTDKLIDPKARMPRIAHFPLNNMKPGESIFIHEYENRKEAFSDVRERVRRCNKSGACVFVAEWINYRQTLEIARIK